jgi:hypothetical protein
MKSIKLSLLFDPRDGMITEVSQEHNTRGDGMGSLVSQPTGEISIAFRNSDTEVRIRTWDKKKIEQIYKFLAKLKKDEIASRVTINRRRRK